MGKKHTLSRKMTEEHNSGPTEVKLPLWSALRFELVMKLELRYCLVQQ